MNPLDEFLSEYGSKTKEAMPAVGKRFGDAVVGGLSAAGAAGAVAGAGVAASKIYDALTKSRDFKEMLSFNPDLQEHHDRDPRMFNQMYTSLRGINPTFGKDPLVAGTFMRRMVDQPTNSGGVLTQAVPSGRSSSMLGDASMLGAGAGASYYSDLAKGRARRDSDPNSDMKSEFERNKMEFETQDMSPEHQDLRHQHEHAKATDYLANSPTGGVPQTNVQFDPDSGKYHRGHARPQGHRP